MTNKTIYKIKYYYPRIQPDIHVFITDAVPGELVWGFRSNRAGTVIYIRDENTQKVLHVELMTGPDEPLHINRRVKVLENKYKTERTS